MFPTPCRLCTGCTQRIDRNLTAVYREIHSLHGTVEYLGHLARATDLPPDDAIFVLLLLINRARFVG